MEKEKIYIKTPTIRLDQFLKWAGIAPTGGQAKKMILEGRVRVNGEVERRRSRVLKPGDEVELEGVCYQVEMAGSEKFP
ncbi:MAG TPA: RNA-binding S4 domain-containing protein [Moorella mulderi]|nr:RNA-binding S4 domain-containing protein [Moorella mulderi]